MHQFESSKNYYIFYKYICYIEISRSINTKLKTVVILEEDRDRLRVGVGISKDRFLLLSIPCAFFCNKMYLSATKYKIYFKLKKKDKLNEII